MKVRDEYEFFDTARIWTPALRTIRCSVILSTQNIFHYFGISFNRQSNPNTPHKAKKHKRIFTIHEVGAELQWTPRALSYIFCILTLLAEKMLTF